MPAGAFNLASLRAHISAEERTVQTADRKVVSLAQQIAKTMYRAGNRSDALDAHDMARTFYRRMSIPARPRIAEAARAKRD